MMSDEFCFPSFSKDNIRTHFRLCHVDCNHACVCTYTHPEEGAGGGGGTTLTSNSSFPFFVLSSSSSLVSLLYSVHSHLSFSSSFTG